MIAVATVWCTGVEELGKAAVPIMKRGTKGYSTTTGKRLFFAANFACTCSAASRTQRCKTLENTDTFVRLMCVHFLSRFKPHPTTRDTHAGVARPVRISRILGDALRVTPSLRTMQFTDTSKSSTVNSGAHLGRGALPRYNTCAL